MFFLSFFCKVLWIWVSEVFLAKFIDDNSLISGFLFYEYFSFSFGALFWSSSCLNNQSNLFQNI